VLIHLDWCVSNSFVGTFIPRKDRMKDLGQNTRFTNLYIKNFGEEMTDDGLTELFSKYGKIVSAIVMKDRNSGKRLGYGFVSYEDHMAAAGVSLVLYSCVGSVNSVCVICVGYGSYEWAGDQ
jgi:polyadenylate-binding protein